MSCCKYALRLIGLALVCCMVLSVVLPSAVAQETTADLQGTVRDQSGAVLAKATVEVTSPALIGVKKLETNSTGYYHFTNLPPGTYTLTVTAQTFATYKQEGIDLAAGRIPTIDVSMKLGAVSETVEVTTQAPLVDVTTNKVQTSVVADEVEDLPKGRSFQSLIGIAPGARNEPLMNGYVLDGASKSENAYLIEGQETKSVYSGESNTNFPVDFIQEVQVKSSGFEAEYGGALGGVVNVIQKKGSNAWHGGVFSYYSGDAFDAEANRVQRYVPNTIATSRTDAPSEYYQPKKDHYRVAEPGFALGGPIMKDRWNFYVSSVPRISSLSRTVNFTSASPTPGNRTFYQNTDTYYSFARTDFAVNQRIRVFGSWQYDYARQSGSSLPGADSVFPSQLNTDATQNADNFNSGIGWVQPNVIFGAGADITVSPTLVGTFRFGRTYNDYQDRGLPSGIRYQYVATASANTGCSKSGGCPALNGNGTPAAEVGVNGFSNIGANFSTLFDRFARKSFSQDMAWFKRAGGTHNFKFGYQYGQQSNDVASLYNQARVRIAWGRAYTVLPANQPTCLAINQANMNQYGTTGIFDSAGNPIVTSTSCRGLYGYYMVRDFATTGKVAGVNHALYAQDSWTIAHGVTLSLGIRADRETLPSYNPTFKGIEFGFGQKIAPRLGAAWDVLQNGKLKLYGSYGRFFDIMNMNLPSGSFGGDYWHDCVYTLENASYSTTILPKRDANNHNCPLTGPAVGSYVGRFIENQDFREPSNDPSNYLVEPNLKPMMQHEYVFGADWAISHDMSLESRYTRKRLDRTIEDAGIVTPNGEQFYIVNPGEGINRQPIAASDCTGCPNQPGVIRNYDALEIRLNKRPTNGRYFGTFSYLYSRLYGNYDGLATADVSDALGRANPNNNRSFDEAYMQFDSLGHIINGPLDTDRPNTFKANGYYNLRWLHMNSILGLTQSFFQGTPLHTYLDMDGGAPQNIVGRGNYVPITQDSTGNWVAGTPTASRMPWFLQTDVNVSHEFHVSKTNENLRLRLEGNVINLFNQHSAINTQIGAATGALTLTGVNIAGLPPIPATSVSGVNYKALMTGYNYIAAANDPANNSILASTYGRPNGWQTGRSMRFKIGFFF